VQKSGDRFLLRVGVRSAPSQGFESFRSNYPSYKERFGFFDTREAAEAAIDAFWDAVRGVAGPKPLKAAKKTWRDKMEEPLRCPPTLTPTPNPHPRRVAHPAGVQPCADCEPGYGGCS
jgi:hypothetical protein